MDASRRRRRPRSNNFGGSNNSRNGSSRQNDGGEGEVDARRDSANRSQSLRDFIAESRRNQRSRQSQNLDDEDDVSVVVAVAPTPGRMGSLLATAPREERPDVRVLEDAVGPRRNIGLEFDEEDRAQEGEGRGVGGGGGRGRGPENGQDRRRGRGDSGRGHAPKGGISELAGGGSVQDEKGERGGGSIDRSSRPSSRSSSSSLQREQLKENVAGDGEVVGEMEGVHPGLATYDSQRSAAGMVDGGGHAGEEEYARMLELMQKVGP